MVQDASHPFEIGAFSESLLKRLSVQELIDWHLLMPNDYEQKYQMVRQGWGFRLLQKIW
jgi:hypothetical protein